MLLNECVIHQLQASRTALTSDNNTLAMMLRRLKVAVEVHDMLPSPTNQVPFFAHITTGGRKLFAVPEGEES